MVLTWISHGCTCVPHPEPPSHLLPHPIPLGHPSAPALSTLSHASNLDWWSVSHMIIYMFQCYSLKSSHPCLLSQSPKVCSLHLCLFCCLSYRVIIVTIFLNSIDMRSYTALVFCFLTYFTLYNRLRFHSGRWILNPWTAREALQLRLLSTERASAWAKALSPTDTETDSGHPPTLDGFHFKIREAGSLMRDPFLASGGGGL